MPKPPSRQPGQPSNAPPPDQAALHAAALRHLARYAATEAGLLRVLERRIMRWQRGAAAPAEATEPAYAAARAVAHALAAAGAVDDAAFAQARARRLLRAGSSRRAVAAHLAAKGVDPGIAGTVLPTPDDEFRAAIAYTRRRRLGPFRPQTQPEPPPETQRELAALARAGFPRDLAERALQLGRDEAERLLAEHKRG